VRDIEQSTSRGISRFIAAELARRDRDDCLIRQPRSLGTRRSNYDAYARLGEGHGRPLIDGIIYPIPSTTGFNTRLRAAI
jgi:hypothetical protein